MAFAHDTELSLVALAALVNTAGREGDTLLDVRDLDTYLARCSWTGSRTRDQAEVDAVRVLRERLRELWRRPEAGVVELVNTLLREGGALPQLVTHDGWGYHVHATPAQAPLADRMAVDFAMAVVEVVRYQELDRLRVCAAEDCEDVMVDLSRNRSRRFCDSTCANRVNVAAFRARRSGGHPLPADRPRRER